MVLPSFEIEGGLPLVLARGLAIAGLFATFGGLLARAVVLRPVLASATHGEVAGFPQAWRRLLWASLGLAVFGLGAWSWLVAQNLADQPDLADTASTLLIVVRDTSFGHIVVVQLGLLLLTGAAFSRWSQWPALAALAGAAVVAEAWHSHAATMQAGVSPLLLSMVVHLLAGAAWLGSLPTLLVGIGQLPAVAGAQACRRFTPLGVACVAALIATATAQFAVLVGGLPRLLGTAYGLVALLKLCLFVLLLVIALRNRFRLTSRLGDRAAGVGRGALLRSLGLETAAGLCVVFAAATLASLPPAMHLQPV